jgi:hypothetical protein
MNDDDRPWTARATRSLARNDDQRRRRGGQLAATRYG